TGTEGSPRSTCSSPIRAEPRVEMDELFGVAGSISGGDEVGLGGVVGFAFVGAVAVGAQGGARFGGGPSARREREVAAVGGGGGGAIAGARLGAGDDDERVGRAVVEGERSPGPVMRFGEVVARVLGLGDAQGEPGIGRVAGECGGARVRGRA